MYILIFLVAALQVVVIWRMHRLEKVLLRDDTLNSSEDVRYPEALALLNDNVEISTELLQEKLGIGYARAARMIDILEKERYVEYGRGSKPRLILKRKQ